MELHSVEELISDIRQGRMVVLLDDDAEPSVSFTNATATVIEGNRVLLSLTLAPLSGRAVSVPILVAGSATDPDDYSVDTLTVQFAAGQSSAQIVLDTVDDGLFEGDESVLMSLGAPLFATLGAITNNAITLVDNQAQPTVEFVLANSSVAESGGSVQVARDFYKIPNEDLLVVCDDFHLDLARLRFRAKGSSGGQKGLGDIIRRLGTEEFSRLRIGVGSLPEHWDAADFVLSKFAKKEEAVVEEAVQLAAGAVADWSRESVHHCMNQYN